LGNHFLRFDDRLETSLRFAGDTNENPLVRWRQLIDILSQNPSHYPSEMIVRGLYEARVLLPQIKIEDRLASVKSLTGRIRSAPLVQFLSADAPQVASAAISGAHLTDEEWAEIIPALPTRARGFLRNRADMGPMTLRTLRIWSSADFLLPGALDSQIGAATLEAKPSVTPPEKGVSPSAMQISDIVERIERLRRNRENGDGLQLTLNDVETKQPFLPVSEIRFETDELGTIVWAEGVPRGAIVGVSVAEPAFDDSPGPDANGASAFRQRMPIEKARMRLCGSPLVEGDWRISAAPFFDSASGRFRGYRGILRRPNAAESAQIRSNRADDGDQMQQLVHELRTPLGAIIGFSEIIEQQLFGPVSSEYRTLAKNILIDARRLLAGFDDLSTAARLESGQFATSSGYTDCSWLASRLAERLHGLSDSLSVTLNLSKADPVRPFATETELTERLFSRLLSAVIIGCEPGEELNGRFRTELGLRAKNSFVLSLPKKLRALTEAELLGSIPSELDNAIDAPLLGLGFSLRLVRNLARSVQGDLRFQKESLLLTLPASKESGLHQTGEERD
jgi:His Kinase A (phospho-acceptor) domain